MLKGYYQNYSIKKTMNLKFLIAGVAIFASALCTSTHASPTWTLTGRGIIAEGFDTTGLFGVKQRSLVGYAFTQKITANTDPTRWEHYDTDGSTRSQLHGVGAGFTTTVTVAGVTVKYTSRLTEEGQQLVISYDQPNAQFSEHIASYQIGITDAGDYVEAYLGAYQQLNGLVTNHTFDQSLNKKFDPLLFFGSTFDTMGWSHEAFFKGGLGSLHVRSNGHQEIPEPGSFALVGLGLAGFAVARRKIVRIADA